MDRIANPWGDRTPYDPPGLLGRRGDGREATHGDPREQLERIHREAGVREQL